MNRILASALVTINAILGFFVILGSVWLAVFMYEQISTDQIQQTDLFGASLLMIAAPIIGVIVAAYFCGMIALLALIESHLKAIKEQGEGLRASKAPERAEPKLSK